MVLKVSTFCPGEFGLVKCHGDLLCHTPNNFRHPSRRFEKGSFLLTVCISLVDGRGFCVDSRSSQTRYPSEKCIEMTIRMSLSVRTVSPIKTVCFIYLDRY